MTLLLLALVAVPLAFDAAGAVRWGALSLVWWYTGVVAPVLAVAVTIVTLLAAPE